MYGTLLANETKKIIKNDTKSDWLVEGYWLSGPAYAATLVKKKYKNVQISYFATSFGGYLLLNFLNNATHKYNKIILRAPAINIDKVLKEKIIKDDFCKLRANEILNIQDIKIDYEFYRDLENNRLIDNYNYFIILLVTVTLFIFSTEML